MEGIVVSDWKFEVVIIPFAVDIGLVAVLVLDDPSRVELAPSYTPLLPKADLVAWAPAAEVTTRARDGPCPAQALILAIVAVDGVRNLGQLHQHCLSIR